MSPFGQYGQSEDEIPHARSRGGKGRGDVAEGEVPADPLPEGDHKGDDIVNIETVKDLSNYIEKAKEK